MISQSAFAGEMLQVRPAGSGSVIATPFASPAPVFSSFTVSGYPDELKFLVSELVAFAVQGSELRWK